MKKHIIVMTLLAALVCTVPVYAGTPGQEYSMEKKELPFYFMDHDSKEVITVWYADGKTDIPYLESETVKELLERAYHVHLNDNNYSLKATIEDDQAIFLRENGYEMIIDAGSDVIRFHDLNMFQATSWQDTVLDIIWYSGYDENGEPAYFETMPLSFSRDAAETDLDCGVYGIDLISAGGEVFIPLQTVSDVLLSNIYLLAEYNGEAVIVDQYDSTAMKDIFYSAAPGNRSEELADFTYHELCFALDQFYGLKEEHGIDSFQQFFRDTGLQERLLSLDPQESGEALAELINRYLDDHHSVYLENSWLLGTETDVIGSIFGPDILNRTYNAERFQQARAAYYPDGIPGYEEIDNTAFITLDGFALNGMGYDYYHTVPEADAPDAIGLLLYAYSQITREGSPVKNVVLDLSCNTGGIPTAACFTIGMFLGDGFASLRDTLTGAAATEYFLIDANLDRKFDEEDSLNGYRLFCLTSPISFSCGNLVPSVFKQSSMVTLLGQTTAGGTCLVRPLSLADGTMITISGPKRLSQSRNGSFYDIEQGIEPDYRIDEPEHYYDREQLVEFIKGIF